MRGAREPVAGLGARKAPGAFHPLRLGGSSQYASSTLKGKARFALAFEQQGEAQPEKGETRKASAALGRCVALE